MEPPTLWLIAIAQRGKSNRPNTWAAYGADLLDFLRFCEANELDYLAPERGLLPAYRDQLQSRRIKRRKVQKRLSSATINRRLKCVARFYVWLHREGLVLFVPFTEEESERPPAPLGSHRSVHNKRTAVAREVTVPSDVEHLPVALEPALIRAICQSMQDRDSIICGLGTSTGARIDEILALNMDQVPNDQRFLTKKSVGIMLTETKRLNPREIFVPIPILIDLNRYIYGVRARIVRKLRDAGKTADDQAVFLSQTGGRLAYRTFWQVFREAADRQSSNAVIHDLRHTFAIHRLAQLDLSAQADKTGIAADPLVTLQRLLGHKWLSTTSTYLKALKPNPHAAEEAMEEFVMQWWPKR